MENDNAARESDNNSGIQSTEADDGYNENIKDVESKRSGTKTCLTSRSKKRAIIDEGRRPEDIIQIENKIDELESLFKTGINDIREAVHSLEAEKRSMEVHIKSLEDSLMYCNTNNKEYEVMTQQLRTEIVELKKSLEKLKTSNNRLLEDNESIQSEHSDHLQSIAKQHRQKRIARRTIENWKRKVRRKDCSMVLLLQSENRKIKDELVKYQEEAKQAFLRSANTLNSEALSMFQKSATRLLQADYQIRGCDDVAHEDSKSVTSESSSHSSWTDATHDHKQAAAATALENNGSSAQSQTHRKSGHEPKLKNGRADFQCREDILDRCSSSKEPDGNWVFGSDNFVRDEHNLDGRRDRFNDNIDKNRFRSNGDRNEMNSNDPLQRKYGGNPYKNTTAKSYIADYVPDALRRETRQIMNNLQTVKKQTFINEASNACQGKTHIHICHCTPQAGKPAPCQYCTAKQNFNFSKMPFAVRPDQNILNKRHCQQTKHNIDSKKSRNVVIASMTPNKENKSKVIYQPSGSTVVIEKHIM